MGDRAMERCLRIRPFREKLGEVLHKLAYHDKPMKWEMLAKSSQELWMWQADRFVTLALGLELRYNLSVEEDRIIKQHKSGYERALAVSSLLMLKEFRWSQLYQGAIKRAETAESKLRELTK